MVLLSNDEFLTQLTLLTQNSKKSSSFTITLKRYDGNDKPTPREGRPALPKPEEYMCLIRAKSKNKKLSTVVKHNDVGRVMESYGKIMKSNMDGLKKVKKNKNKSKAVQG
uniref:Signal recognition particle 14 kDa protein n=1 Tax=Corethrella appendiculata TaxID=1370023 RepID=U5EM27_9DIPT